jgi:pSer/pThr/pTyr-binding forkhead associated (FHA) protein
MSGPDSTNIEESWLELPDSKVFWLKGRCSVGRHADNDLVFPVVGLSRHHALILPSEAGFTLTDLQSINGTYVNDELINRPTLLNDGDEVRFVDVVVRFRCTRRVDTGDIDDTERTTTVVEHVRMRTCLLVIADVEGYCSLIDRIGSESAIKILQEWITMMRPMIERNGGTINSYAGDAIFSYWVLESSQPAQVIAALREFDAYRERSPCKFRVVVHGGPIMLTKSEKGEELGGQDVNFAFRSEKIAKRLQCRTMLSQAAVEALGIAATSVPVGTSKVDGISGDFSFFALPPV